MTSLIQLFTGNNITQSHTEPLQSISVASLKQKIAEGSDGIAALCKQLRTALRMDKKAYDRMKLRLPFFCCSSFDKNIRHGNNFSHAESLVLDLDNIDDKQALQEEIWPQITADNRAILAFRSPSGKGIKILFGLNSPITSLQQFSIFYRQFAKSFAETHKLQAYLDSSTSDATRVCFLAHDPQVHYNPHAQLLAWQGPEHYELSQHTEKRKQGADSKKDEQTKHEQTITKTLPEAVYKQVVQRIGLVKTTKPPKNPIVVPEILEPLMIQLQAAIAANNWSIKEIRDIQYGKKIVVAEGFLWAEINVFYGKKGFSIVRTPKNGSDAVLSEKLEALVWQTLQIPCDIDYRFNPDA